MSLLESRKLFASIVLLSWRLSAQPVDYVILCIPSHPSSSCKYKRRERAMLNTQHSPRVQLLLVVFMDAIDLLWLLVPVRLGIRVANPHIKECRALGIPEATRPNVQSCFLCSIGPSTELFFSDVLENWLDLDVATHHIQKICLQVVVLQNPLVCKSLRGLL